MPEEAVSTPVLAAAEEGEEADNGAEDGARPVEAAEAPLSDERPSVSAVDGEDESAGTAEDDGDDCDGLTADEGDDAATAAEDDGSEEDES